MAQSLGDIAFEYHSKDLKIYEEWMQFKIDLFYYMALYCQVPLKIAAGMMGRNAPFSEWKIFYRHMWE